MIGKHHIPLSNFSISKEGKKLVNKVLDTNRLTYGPYTSRFEKQFATLHGVKYALFCNSGTSALQVAIDAMKKLNHWADGDEILVPAITFIASSNAVIHNNLTPVFVDVDPTYYTIDPTKIEAKITPRTRAIMPVHLFGQSCDMGAISALAKKYQLLIIEDACEALFTRYKKKLVGSLSDVAIFSTYAAHTITTGVGGIVVTDNEDIASVAKSLIFHGRDAIYHTIDDDDTNQPLKLVSLIERRFHFPYIGYSFRLTEMEAALGLAQLSQKNTLVKGRINVVHELTKILSPFADKLQTPAIRKDTSPVFMLYPLVIIDKAIDRDDLLLFLEKHGIETRLFFPLLSQPIYKKLFGDQQRHYPIAKMLVERGFIIGCHPYIKHIDCVYINQVFSQFFKKSETA